MVGRFRVFLDDCVRPMSLRLTKSVSAFSAKCLFFRDFVVPRAGIEPATRGFSILRNFPYFQSLRVKIMAGRMGNNERK